MPDAHDATNSQPLTDAEKQHYFARMKAAWKNLPPDKKFALEPLLEESHQQFGNFVQTGKAPEHKYHVALRMKSYLTNDQDKHLAAAAAKALEITVGPEGEILGTGKYQQLDPSWELKTGTIWLENLLHKHPFPSGMPAPRPMPDEGKVRIALAGDFGTGNFGPGDSPSTKISRIMASLQPHFTIHLGDVYYAGTADEEADNLLKYWPPGSLGSFTLNSNHEMYPGGTPYFNDAVRSSLFKQSQEPFSFFALENSKWIIVGLDSAYNAGELDLFMNGSLGNNAQLPFLRSLAQKRKKVIVLTHHNGFDLAGFDPAKPLKLFTEVLGAFQGAAPPAYWYWGHVHAGAVYKPLKDYSGVLCRCAGHAALPWGLSSELKASSQVDWFERYNAGDPDDKLRVFNGCVLLELDGDNLSETFYDEKGRIAWSPDRGDTRAPS